MISKNTIALITGANRGIGKAYAEALLKEGVRKIYLAVRDTETVKDFIASAPNVLIPLKLDITKAEDIKEAAEIATDVNLLINNAGALFPNALDQKQEIENARTQMEVNYFGPMRLTAAFTPILEGKANSAVIIVSSIAGYLFFPGATGYCASKFAITAYIRGARETLGKQGIKVIGVYPGPTDTDMAKNMDVEKDTTIEVALQTIEGLKKKEDDIFTGNISQTLYKSYCEAPVITQEKMFR